MTFTISGEFLMQLITAAFVIGGSWATSRSVLNNVKVALKSLADRVEKLEAIPAKIGSHIEKIERLEEQAKERAGDALRFAKIEAQMESMAKDIHRIASVLDHIGQKTTVA